MEKEKKLCIREIKDNIERVFSDQPLTRPLSTLNKDCRFKQHYNIAFDLRNEKRIKEEESKRKREYRERPENKARQKEYRERPENKAKQKEYYKDIVRKKLNIKPENYRK